jgi:hypothetical protein
LLSKASLLINRSARDYVAVRLKIARRALHRVMSCATQGLPLTLAPQAKHGRHQISEISKKVQPLKNLKRLWISRFPF